MRFKKGDILKQKVKILIKEDASIKNNLTLQLEGKKNEEFPLLDDIIESLKTVRKNNDLILSSIDEIIADCESSIDKNNILKKDTKIELLIENGSYSFMVFHGSMNPSNFIVVDPDLLKLNITNIIYEDVEKDTIDLIKVFFYKLIDNPLIKTNHINEV